MARDTTAARSAGARSMRGERENDSSESTTSRRRAISPTTCGRRRATRACVGGILGDQLDRHAQAVERVLQLVGDRRRRLAHRREALGVDQRRLRRHQLRGPIAHPLLQQRSRRRAAPGRACGSTSPCRSNAPRSAAISSVPRRSGRSAAGTGSPRAMRIAPLASACSGRGEVARQQHARDRRDDQPEQHDADQRPAPAARCSRSASARAARTRPRTASPRARARTRTAYCCPFASPVSVPLLPRAAAAIASAQPEPSAARVAIGRIDDLPARRRPGPRRCRFGRLSCNAGAIRLSSASAMTPDQRTRELLVAHQRLHDLQRAAQARLVGHAEQRSRRPAARRREPRPLPERLPAELRPVGHGADAACRRRSAAAPRCCRGPSSRGRRRGPAPPAGSPSRRRSSSAAAPGASARPRGSRSCRAARRRGSRRTAATRVVSSRRMVRAD